MSAIEISGLVKSYSNFRALDALDLTLDGGQVVGLLGENGCGKTTLMKVLSGALKQYEGEVAIYGQSPGVETKSIVSYLPDKSFLANNSTIESAEGVFVRFFEDFNRGKFNRLMGSFGIDQKRKLNTLSKGQREKVQIALSMSRDAKVFLLDEPISGVDPAARDAIIDAILQDLPVGSLVVISTHLIHDLEPILDSVVLMRRGKVLLSGNIESLRQKYGKSTDQLFREMYR